MFAPSGRFVRLRPMAKEKDVTINELAQMVQRGFGAVDESFSEVYKRLDRIENILLRAHDNRLERLEDFMLEAKKVLKIK